MAYFKTRGQLALQELARRKKIASYQHTPDKWLAERLGEDDKLLYWNKYPEYETHRWDATPNPFAETFAALANKEWCGLESATSTGKTYLLPRVIFWFLDTFPNSLVVTTAPKKDQLRRILWTEVANAFAKFKKIRPHADLLTLNLTVDGRSKKLDFKPNAKGIFEMESSVGHEAIGIVAGVGAGEESATKMQGFHRENMLFILEECAGIHPAVLTAIINTSTADNNLILAVGNPDSELDALHTFCNMQRVRHITVSAYDHPNVVLNKEIIPGAVTTSSIEFRKQEYGEESPFFKSRVRGIAPTESTDSLIKSEYFEQCLEVGERFIGVPFNTENFFNALGVDVANSEAGDMAALAWGQGNKLKELQEFYCSNATHLAYNVIFDDVKLSDRKNKIYGTNKISNFNIMPQCVGVDGVGIGVATVNAFYDEGYQVISLLGGQLDFAIRTGVKGEDLFQFSALRSQMYFEAREDLRTGQVIIGLQDKQLIRQLKRELVTIKYTIKSGKIHVEKKEEIKKRLGGKSPNLADAFVYWNWMRKGYYVHQQLPFR